MYSISVLSTDKYDLRHHNSVLFPLRLLGRFHDVNDCLGAQNLDHITIRVLDKRKVLHLT